MSNFQLVEVPPGAFQVNVFNVGSVDSAALGAAAGLTFSNSDNLWFSNIAAGKIYNSTNSGTLVSDFLTTDIDSLSTSQGGVSYSSSGNLWWADFGTNKIYNSTTDGSSLISFFTTTDVDSSAETPRGISFSNSDNLWWADDGTGKIYNSTNSGTLISFFATTDIDGSATSPQGVSWSTSGNLWWSDEITNKIYNSTTDGSSLISSFLTTDADSVATEPKAVTFTSSDNLWFAAGIKIYNSTNSGTLVVQSLSQGIVTLDLLPEYDYRFSNNMINRQDQRTKEGSLFTYIENGRFGEFRLPLSWVGSSDRSQINSWWSVGTDLRFRDNSDFPNSYHDVRIMGNTDPFNTFVRPYFQEFYQGEIILETT